jgi:hypothetical protein
MMNNDIISILRYSMTAQLAGTKTCIAYGVGVDTFQISLQITAVSHIELNIPDLSSATASFPGRLSSSSPVLLLQGNVTFVHA